MSAEPGKVFVVERTDVGRYRENNEDSHGNTTAADGSQLFVVADGMGGFEAGEVASAEAIKGALAAWVLDADQTLPWRLNQCATESNEYVMRAAVAHDLLGNMGTTLVMLAIQNGVALVGHIGDSRCYMIRDGEMVRLTRDHTEAELLVDEGVIEPEAADHHELSHVLTACLGLERGLVPECTELITLQDNDTFVLCSDGLNGVVDDQDIAEIVSYHTLDRGVDLLVSTANHHGGPDNITVQIVRYGTDTAPLEDPPDGWVIPQKRVERRPTIVVMILLLLVLVAILLGVALSG